MACYIPVLLLGLQLTPRTVLGEIGPGWQHICRNSRIVTVI
jgi:hypothetical protein